MAPSGSIMLNFIFNFYYTALVEVSGAPAAHASDEHS